MKKILLSLLLLTVTSANAGLPPIKCTGENYLTCTSNQVITANAIDLTSDITGVLPIADGGTNSSTALNNNRIMISNSGGIIEQSGLTAGRVLVTDSFGLPITSSTTTTTLGYVDPTSSIQTQFNNLNTDLGNYIPLTQKAAVNGVATLGSTGYVPLSQIDPSLTAGLKYQGTWNAATNTPTLTSGVGTAGYFYDVSVAGTTCLDGVCLWGVQDFALFNGTVWQKIPNAVTVSSVNGLTGAVVLNTDNISEGLTNLYYTDARARSSISASSPLGYDSTGGVMSCNTAGASAAGCLTSTDWNTFSNKQGALPSGTSLQYLRGDLVDATLNTSVVPESGNLYYTTARFDNDFSTETTDNLSEGITNLYFTNARARGAFSFIDSLAASSGTVSLVNDVSSPGNSYYYGTNSSGIKGYYSISSGSVSSVGLADGSTSPIYSISGSPVTSSGTLTFTLSNETANKVLSGPTTGTAAQPTFRSLVGADLPNPSASTLGGVESVASLASNWVAYIDTSGVPHQSQPAFSDVSGQTTLSQLPSIANVTFLGNNSGSTGVPSALSATTATSMLNTFSSTLKGLVPASGGGTTNFLRADGSFAAPPGVGTVTSVGLSDASTSPIFTISGSPVTGSGTLTETLSNESANLIFSGPSSGSAAQPNFRSLVGADLPNPSSSTLGGVQSAASVSHQFINSISTSGVPALSQPAFSDVSGNATLSQLPSISNNTVIGNVSGSPATPSALTQTQLTSLINTFTSSLSGAVPSSPGGTSTFLRADGSFAVPPGTGGSGSVTSVSVVSANGLAGTVATSTTTPAITLSTTITGILKGNGTAISAASAGTDYQVPLTFSTGLTNASNTITANLSTGISGGQTAIGGTASADNLKLQSTTNATKGYIGVNDAVRGTLNYGSVSLGSAPFDGSTSGKFVGTSSSGTELAINTPSGYAGYTLDFQNAGTSFLNMDATGNTTINPSASGSATGFNLHPVWNGGSGTTPVGFLVNPIDLGGVGSGAYIAEFELSSTALLTLSKLGQLSLTPASITGSSSANSFSIAQTWNGTGTPIALKVNVTDSASNAASLLMDLQKGGTSQFNVGKAGTVTSVGNITAGTTAAFVGTATNNNAAAGNIGEYVTGTIASGSAVSLTTATSKNITSISLTAGDWDVSGVIDYLPSTATTSQFESGTSSTTNTLGGQDTYAVEPLVFTLASPNYNQITPVQRFSLSGTTTVYLVANATFSAGTVTAYGTIRARRVR